jgi:Protein of unknown function (DUF3788)
MAYGAFVERTQRPTAQGVREVLGRGRSHWDALAEFMTKTYKARSDFTFYGRSFGWAVTYRKAGRSLLALFPAKGTLTALVVLGHTEVGWAHEVRLSEAVRTIIEGAPEFKEGRWLFVPVRTKKDVVEVEKLVLAKAPPRSGAWVSPGSSR